MANDNFVESMAAQFGQTATVKNLFGEPVRTGDKTIIPVGQIAYGCGGGYGHGKNPMVQKMETSKEATANMGEGAGGGGGMYARPKGVYEITPTSTRFIPASGARILATGILIGLLAHMFFSRKHK